jgi:hypothetical protein
VGHRSSLLHQDVPEDVEGLLFFLNGEDVKAAAEDRGEVPFPKKMVVVVSVDDPVARTAFTRVMFEAGAEGGQV